MLKKYFSNPYFILLLAGNLYCIWYFNSHPNGFVTVLWIYWLQSIIIGFFNFIDLLTIKNYNPGGFKLNNQPITAQNKGCLPWFFLIHFGGFHLGYLVFIGVLFGLGANFKFILIGAAAFFAESLLAFVQRKQAQEQVQVSIGSLFFLPYLRILPMHLVILAPAFLGWQPSIVFLVLKTLADVLSFILYQRMWQKAAKN